MDVQLRALADGTRRRIVRMVWNEEQTATEIASKFAMSGPAVSQHLRVLFDADLISLRREGTRRFYRANQAVVARLQAELAQIWDESLPNLKLAAEKHHNRRRR